MRWIVILFLLVSSPALAQSGSVKTKAQLNTEISTNFPDNSANSITPFTLRQTLLDILVSSLGTNTASLTTEIGANLPTNSSGNIHAGTLQQTLLDIVTNTGLFPAYNQATLTSEINTYITATVTPASLRRVLGDLVTAMQLVTTEPCDLIACAEAWSVTRGMSSSYTGPLFQLTNGSSTLDIGMAASRTVDMTTWSSFCTGVSTHCHITKIYAQIQGTHNNLVAMDFDSAAFYGCSAGSPCRAEFRIEAATGLPRVEAGCDPGGGNGATDGCSTSSTPGPGKYLVDVGASDTALVGVYGGTHATTVIYNGAFPTTIGTKCCGSFGIAHQFQAAQVDGSDFMVSIGFNNGGDNKYFFDIDGENIISTTDIGSVSVSPINYLVLIDHDGAGSPPSNSTIWYNGHTIWSQVTMQSQFVYNINGPYMRMGGGGDMSQRAPILFREGLITNSVLSAAEKAAVLINNQAFYPALSFP